MSMMNTMYIANAPIGQWSGSLARTHPRSVGCELTRSFVVIMVALTMWHSAGPTFGRTRLLNIAKRSCTRVSNQSIVNKVLSKGTATTTPHLP